MSPLFLVRCRRLTVSAALFALWTTGVFRPLPACAQTSPSIVSYVPGSTVVFPPSPSAATALLGNLNIYCKRTDVPRAQTLTLRGRLIGIADGTSAFANVVQHVGFDTPQLPHGTYHVWWGSPNEPTGTVQADSIFGAHQTNDAAHSMTIQITPQLEFKNATIYGNVGETLYAEVRLHGPNTPPGIGINFFDSTSYGGSTSIPLTLQQTSGTTAQSVNNPGKMLLVPNTASVQFKVSGTGTSTFTVSAPDYLPGVLRIVSPVPPPANDPATLSSQLEPGDVLLYDGNMPLVSQVIVLLEREELGPTCIYSHAAIYVGKRNGVPMVAEMLAQGYVLHSLTESQSGANAIDVFRNPALSAAQRQAIADKALGYGNHTLLYAYPQIAVLADAAVMGKAGLNVVTKAKLRAEAAAIEVLTKGHKAMICSEMVAWAYSDAGQRLGVSPWRAVADSGLWTSDLDRQMDMTTPNMLARSPNLRKVFRLFGP